MHGGGLQCLNTGTVKEVACMARVLTRGIMVNLLIDLSDERVLFYGRCTQSLHLLNQPLRMESV